MFVIILTATSVIGLWDYVIICLSDQPMGFGSYNVVGNQ
jgi:hypothetical protein